MKFAYLVPILAVSAALGATHGTPGDGARALAPPPAPATPPWLAADWQGEDDDDPHAGLYAAAPAPDESGTCTYDPDGEAAAACDACDEGAPPLGDDAHAGLYPSDDPHAGLYPSDDPTGPPDVHAAVERSRASNGKTVAEVFATRRELDQKQVTVRGTVVKLTEGVLGKTYLHLRDGTGSPEQGDDDLTVTTTESLALGETVELEGWLAIDQDVGVGYSYPALLADAARVPR